MALNAKKLPSSGGSKQELLAPENYMARVVEVIDLGVQPQRAFEGKKKGPIRMIRVTYELGTEFMQDDDGKDILDKPRWMSEKFPLFGMGADRAKSTLRYKALDPLDEHDGDWAALGGTPCLVAIVNNESKGKTYNNIGSVSPPIKGIPVPELVNPIKVFDVDEPDMEVFTSLPDWLQGDIKGNLEYEGSVLEAAVLGKAVDSPSDTDAPADTGAAAIDAGDLPL